MSITEIEHIKQLPEMKVRGYALSAGYTEKEAARDYEARYGVEAGQGWKWRNYVYLELPEGRG
jgi:hypothetical protein